MVNEMALSEILAVAFERLKKQSEEIYLLQIELKAWRQTMRGDSGEIFISELDRNRKHLLATEPYADPYGKEYDELVQKLRAV